MLGLSRTWVLPGKAGGNKADVAAYYTLAGSSVSREALPKQSKSLPAYPVPIILLARLAVSLEYQHKQLGMKTLVHALQTACSLSQQGIPAVGVVIDVLDNEAMNFYHHAGIFTPFSDNPLRLFVHMSAIAQL